MDDKFVVFHKEQYEKALKHYYDTIENRRIASENGMAVTQVIIPKPSISDFEYLNISRTASDEKRDCMDEKRLWSKSSNLNVPIKKASI